MSYERRTRIYAKSDKTEWCWYSVKHVNPLPVPLASKHQGQCGHETFQSIAGFCSRGVKCLVKKIEEGQLQTSICMLELYDNLITKASQFLGGGGASHRSEGPPHLLEINPA